MKHSVQKWIRYQVSRDALASDIPRMLLAVVAALLTRYALAFILIDLTSWVSAESVSEATAWFITYFLFCVYYFVLSHRAFGHLDAGDLRASLKSTRPESTDPFTAFVSGESGTSHATIFSLVALVGVGIISFNTDMDSDSHRSLLLQASGLLTVIGSWISNAASFALQYARDDADERESGFRFPEGTQPVWSDYLYTAIMVSATLSTADVDVVSRKRRRMVSIHTIIAFAFNTVIIAMLVATIM